MATVTLHQRSLGITPQPDTTKDSPAFLDISEWVIGSANGKINAYAPALSGAPFSVPRLVMDGPDLFADFYVPPGYMQPFPRGDITDNYGGTVTSLYYRAPFNIGFHDLGYAAWSITDLSIDLRDIAYRDGIVIPYLLSGDDVITGHDPLPDADVDDGGNVLSGFGGNDTLIGLGGDDALYGGAGDDVLNAGWGRNTADGGEGTDTLVLYGVREGYSIERDGDTLTVTGFNGKQQTTATGIEKLFFTDSGEVVELEPKGEILFASPEGGWMAGTEGDDTFVGGAGKDVFYGGAGDDAFLGGDDGYNQVDLDGWPSDYRFFRADDGTVIAVSDRFGTTDTMVQIAGIWFDGEQRWYALDDLIDNPAQGEILFASDQGGWLAGTAGDDTLIGGAGEDVLYGGAGNDAFIGGDTGYNQVNLDGSAADYTFFRADDGTVIAASDTYGTTDTMVDITAVYFEESDQWAPIEALVG